MKENSALMEACADGDLDQVKLLLSSHAINLRNEWGNTALFFACMHSDNFSLIKLLVKKGAQVNLVNKNGETPLLVAYTHECDRKTFLYLLKRTNKPCLNSFDQGNQRLIDIVCEKKDFETAQLIFKKKGVPEVLSASQVAWLKMEYETLREQHPTTFLHCWRVLKKLDCVTLVETRVMSPTQSLNKRRNGIRVFSLSTMAENMEKREPPSFKSIKFWVNRDSTVESGESFESDETSMRQSYDATRC